MDVGHEDFAERAGRRLGLRANRLECEAKRPCTDGKPSRTTARAQELRVAALLLRDEAVAMGREERETRKEKVAENLSLQAQG
jgi:hypothetical protein